MRNTFINKLTELARENDNILLIVGDLGYNVIEPFANEFPERFFNAGIAEQNMAGLAAGLASEGFHVFTYSIANFPTFRCAEQIRNDIDYHNLNVTTVTVGGGLSYGNLGYSHHAIQDYALMRSLPNMLIASPCDPLEVEASIEFLIKNPQPSYLRLGKAGEPNFHKFKPNIIPGEWEKIYNGKSDKCIVCTGNTVNLALKWIKLPEYENFTIFSIPIWGMKFTKNLSKNISNFKKIVTLEDHLIDAGFGSWILENTYKEIIFNNIDFEIKGLNNKVCGLVGSQKYLNNQGGIDY